MKNYIPEYKELITCYDSSTNTFSERTCKEKERLEIIQDLLKYPGEMNLDSRSLVSRRYAETFDKDGSYTNAVPGTYDFGKFYEQAKKECYSGLLIDDEVYFTGDHIFYLNFHKIPDKVKQDLAFARIFDTDCWYYQLLQLAWLQRKFTVTLKKRQIGISLKLVSKMAKRVIFEKAFRGKLASWDERYTASNWDLLQLYLNYINENTAWYRGFTKKKYNWTQQQEEEDGTIIGLKSNVMGVVTKTNAAAPVSGKTDEVFIDEAGINANLSETMGFVEPAMTFGNLVTGEVHVAGAVGKLKLSEDLKKYFFSPRNHHFLTLENRWSKKGGECGIFIPESYSYGDMMDEFGNSDVKGAEEAIKAEYQKREENNSYKDYMLYKSQHPLTPEDCFEMREESAFPVHIIKPHYDWLEREYRPTVVTLREVPEPNGQSRIERKLGSPTPIVEDYPVTKDTKKEGAVVIDEAPIQDNPPFGLYYAAVDTIKRINTDNSVSLQTIYIYKAAHEIDGELAMDKPVAWYAGRHADVEKTYENCLYLMKLYNARTAVESDQPNFIEWLIGKNETNLLMRRSDMPILTEWVPKSQIKEEYGWRTGSGNSAVKDRLYELLLEYVEEVIGYTFNPETGESQPIYGVTRIKDKMLLKEMLEPSGNADRIIAFSGVLMAARSNTRRGLKVKSENRQENQRLIRESLQRHTSFNSLQTAGLNSLRRSKLFKT